MSAIITRFYELLRSTERYTRVDMVYLFRSAFLLTGSDIVLAFVSLGVSVLFAAYVPKETYGIYRYVISIANIAVAFSLTGMNSAVTRAVARGREGAFRKSLFAQAPFALLQFAAAGTVAVYYFWHGNAAYGLALTTVAVLAPVSGVLNTYVAYLNGKKAFGRLSWWNIQGGVLNSVAVAAVILTQPTVLALTIAYYLSTLITNAYFTWRTFRVFRPTDTYEPEDLSYGKHLSVMNSIGMLATQLDSVLIYHLLGPVALATYSFAIIIPERMRSLLGFLPNIALPKLAERTSAELRKTAGRRALVALISTGLLALLYAVAAPFIFHTFFSKYAEAIPYSQLAGCFVMVIAPAYLSTLLTAEGSKRALYIVSITTPFLKIVLSVTTILAFGIWGAIIARLVSGAYSGILTFVLLEKAEPGT